MFHLNLRLISAAPENKIITHQSLTTEQLLYPDVINPQNKINQLRDTFAEQIKRSSVEVPPNAENLSASNLELLSQRLRQGKIKTDSIQGYTDNDGSFVVVMKLKG